MSFVRDVLGSLRGADLPVPERLERYCRPSGERIYGAGVEPQASGGGDVQSLRGVAGGEANSGEKSTNTANYQG